MEMKYIWPEDKSIDKYWVECTLEEAVSEEACKSL